MDNFVELYFPSVSEISQADLLNARARLEAEYALRFPELDTRPNSVFGDLWLTPAAHLLASLEIAGTRYKSDLDLGNVANGVIYDCDFVERYLRNFSTLQSVQTLASGAIRLVFNADGTYNLPRNLSFTGPSGGLFNLRLPFDDGLTVLPAGSSVTPGVNQRVLSNFQGIGWVVDLQVSGEMPAPILGGQPMETSEPLPALVSCTALNDFLPGLPDNRLASIARLTRDTFYSATPSTKGGFRSYLRRQFPDILGVSAVTSGDDSMTRDLDVSQRYVDVFVRGPQTISEDLVVRAKLDAVSDRFIAEVPQTIPSVLLEDIRVTADETLALDPSGTRTYYRTPSTPRLPGWSGAYSDGQRVYFTVQMPRDPVTDDPLIDTEVLGGDEFANFTVTLRFDPLFPAISEHMQGDDQKIMGVDTLYRQPVVVRVNQMTVQYRREPGTRVRIEQARQEIHEYLNNLMFPDVLTEARVYDSMFYAGVKDVVSVSISARVLWGPGEYTVPSTAPDPLVDLSGFEGASTAGTVVTFSNLQELLVVTTGTGYAVSGPENYRLMLDAEDIVFEEVA